MSAEVRFTHGTAQTRGALLATARAEFKRTMAYAIDVIRAPLSPLVYFGTTYLAYSIAGRQTVAGVNLAGFLLVGMFGQILWSSSVWSSGQAIEAERYEGTIAALFVSPASRLAVVAGYGLGGFLFDIPSVLVLLVLGVATGAQLNIADPLAMTLAAGSLLVASLAVGFTLAGLFVLTRRANLMSNVIQHPVYLLGGFVIPRAALPGWLRPFADALPFGHATDALRASALSAASLADIAPELGWSLALSALFALVGALLIRKVEHAAKRTGQLELY